MFNKEKIKIRYSFDSIGLLSTLVSQKNRERLTLRRTKTITQPAGAKFKISKIINLSTDSSISDSVDESETGTVIIGPETENIDSLTSEKQQVIRVDCERIKISYSLYGELEISQQYLLFISEGNEKPTDGKFFGSALKFTQENKRSTKFVEVEEISEVFPRRFIHKHTAFEVFLKSGKSFLFNVFTADIRKSVFEVIKS